MSEPKAVVAVYHASEQMKYVKSWSKLGVFLGTIWGLISGTVLVGVAGTGPVLVAGSLVTSAKAALEGGVVIGALSAIGAGLYGIRILKDGSIQSKSKPSANRLLLLGYGSKSEIARVKRILKTTPSVTLDLCSLNADNCSLKYDSWKTVTDVVGADQHDTLIAAQRPTVATSEKRQRPFLEI